MDAHAIEPEVCTPRASYRLEFGLNFMPHHRKENTSSIHIGNPELLRTQRHTWRIPENRAAGNRRFRVCIRLYLLTHSLGLMLGGFIWSTLVLALTTICYLTILLVLLYFLFDNNQEQPNSRRISARQRHIAKISLLPAGDRETISRSVPSQHRHPRTRPLPINMSSKVPIIVIARRDLNAPAKYPILGIPGEAVDNVERVD